MKRIFGPSLLGFFGLVMPQGPNQTKGALKKV